MPRPARYLGVEAAYLVFALCLEATWTWPGLVLLGWPAAAASGAAISGAVPAPAWHPALPVAGALAVLAAAVLAARLLAATRLPLAAARAAAAGLGVAVAALAIHAACYPGLSVADPAWLAATVDALRRPLSAMPPLRAFLAAAFLYWRGVGMASEEVAQHEAWRRFGTGIVGLIALLIMAALSTSAGSAARGAALSPWPVAAAFVFGLALAGAANLAEVRTMCRAAPRALGGSGSVRWAGIAAVSAIALLGAGLAIAAVLSPASVASALRLLAPVGRFLSLVLYGVVAVFGFFAYLLAALVWRLIGRADAPTIQELLTLTRPDIPDVPAGDPGLPGLLNALRWAAAVLAVAAACYLFARSLRRRRRPPAAAGLEWRESVWSWRSLRAGLAAALRRWAGLGGRRRPSLDALGGLPAGIRRARALYRAALRRAARAGRPRRPAETPDEFRPSLDRLYGRWGAGRGAGAGPGAGAGTGAEPAASLTAAYNVARYGERSPDAASLARVIAAWRPVLAAPLRRGAGPRRRRRGERRV